MSEQNSHHHHHHHGHKLDGASKFKRDSLNAIERDKALAKWGKRILIVIAILMGLAVVIAYTIG
jgi:hypothetical protein